MTLKKIDQENKELDFWQGLTFGFGFMVAMFVFSVIVVPVILCSILIVLAQLGVAIGG